MHILPMLGLVSALLLANGGPAVADATAFTPPQVNIENNGTLDYKTTLAKYDAAVKACLAEPAVKDDASYVACLNRRLAAFKLVVSL